MNGRGGSAHIPVKISCELIFDVKIQGYGVVATRGCISSKTFWIWTSMTNTKTILALSYLVAISLLSGCAASVKSGGAETLTIDEAAKKNLVVNIQGNGKVQQNEDWIRLRQEWNQALKDEATRAGYRLTESHVADPAKTDGVGIKINVTNFRYLTPGARYAAGVMVGNAWINSSADYSDLKSGRLIGTRTYDTSSSAWEGVMSAMTQEQVEAIAQQIMSDIKSAKTE